MPAYLIRALTATSQSGRSLLGAFRKAGWFHSPEAFGRAAFLGPLLLSPFPAVAGAQVPAPGARLRVQAGARYTGAVLEADSNYLALELDGSHDTKVVLLATVQRLDVSRGRHRDTLRGAAIGSAVGAIGGAFIGLAGRTQRCDAQLNYCAAVAPGVSSGRDALLFSVIGAAVGSVIGFLSHRDSWETAAFPGSALGASPRERQP